MAKKTDRLVIAIDAMGGDKAPDIVIEGAHISTKSNKDISFLIYGDKNIIDPLLQKHSDLKNISKVIHTEDKISSNEKPSIALRRGKKSSMRLAIDAVKNKEAQAIISAGNTGALMAMSKIVLRPLPGIDRPAICSLFPTENDLCVLLDLGANIECTSDNLVQFALMGDAFAKVTLKKEKPRVAILNVGSEDIKGSEIVKLASDELQKNKYNINFCGYIEGDEISKGKADVIVTDGFTGNITLKTAEGTAKICMSFFKKALNSSILAKIGGLLAKKQLKKTFKSLDPRLHNGAMFVGLNGIAVKSHGGTDAIGFANAINVAIKLAKNNINKQISEELAKQNNNE